jgi:hypothetical protein
VRYSEPRLLLAVNAAVPLGFENYDEVFRREVCSLYSQQPCSSFVPTRCGPYPFWDFFRLTFFFDYSDQKEDDKCEDEDCVACHLASLPMG